MCRSTRSLIHSCSMHALKRLRTQEPSFLSQLRTVSVFANAHAGEDPFSHHHLQQPGIASAFIAEEDRNGWLEGGLPGLGHQGVGLASRALPEAELSGTSFRQRGHARPEGCDGTLFPKRGRTMSFKRRLMTGGARGTDFPQSPSLVERRGVRGRVAEKFLPEVQHCRKCGKPGHNKRSCTEVEVISAPPEQWVRLQTDSMLTLAMEMRPEARVNVTIRHHMPLQLKMARRRSQFS